MARACPWLAAVCVLAAATAPLAAQPHGCAKQNVRRLPCRSLFEVDPATGQWGLQPDALAPTEPVLLDGCQDDSLLLTILRQEFGPIPLDWIKDVWGDMPVDLFGTGPFHLQLGSSMLPMVPLTSATLGIVLDEATDLSFAFQATKGNPAATIVGLVEDTMDPAQLQNDQFYSKFWKAFTANLFSLGGRGSGAPFHFHELSALFLARGEKKWVLAPNDAVPPKELFWTPPGQWMVGGGAANASTLAAAEAFCARDDVYATSQAAGELLLVPSWWYHATVNSAPGLTIGFGAQSVKPGYTPDRHPTEQGLSEPQRRYAAAYAAGDMKAAEEAAKVLMTQLPGQAGPFLRLLFTSLRNEHAETAKAAYWAFHDEVVAGIRAGLLRPSDFDFVFRDHARNILGQEHFQQRHQAGTPGRQTILALIDGLDADTSAVDAMRAAGPRADDSLTNYSVAGLDGFYDVADLMHVDYNQRKDHWKRGTARKWAPESLRETELWLQHKYRTRPDDSKGFGDWFRRYDTPAACFKDAAGRTTIAGPDGPVALQRVMLDAIHAHAQTSGESSFSRIADDWSAFAPDDDGDKVVLEESVGKGQEEEEEQEEQVVAAVDAPVTAEP